MVDDTLSQKVRVFKDPCSPHSSQDVRGVEINNYNNLQKKKEKDNHENWTSLFIGGGGRIQILSSQQPFLGTVKKGKPLSCNHS